MCRFGTILSLLMTSLWPALAQQDVISTAIGGGPNHMPATEANINQPNALAVDGAGNYYISAYGQNRVFKVNTAGTLTALAGNGTAGDSGDTVVGGAPNAQLHGPDGLAVDNSGNVYIGEYSGCVIRKVDNTNTITTIAGTGTCGYSGDGGPATSANLYYPLGLALDTSGNLYIADYYSCRIRKIVLATGIISTFAGSGTCSYSGDGGPAISAGIAYPGAVAVDNAGDVFIGDFNSYRIREVAASTMTISTIAGTGSSGTGCPTGVAIDTTIGQQYQGVAVNPAGTLVTISDYSHSCVRQITVGGNISTVAGTGTASFCGDGGPATSACLSLPQAIGLASSGNIYVADNNNNRVREFTVGGTINTVAGNGNITFPTLVSGIPANGVVFNNPIDVLEDPSGNVFISDYSNCMVREFVKATGLVNIFAGSAAAGAVTGTCGFSGEGGPATSAQLGVVESTTRDSQGNIYIADGTNCVVWQVSASTGNISVFAGANPKSCGYAGDGGPATSAKLYVPAAVFVDGKNNLYIADSTNNRVREVTNGTISTIAGNGTAGYLGDGDPATAAELNDPMGVTVDSAGNVYIADYSNCVIREVSAGTISTVAGNGVCGFNSDGIATEHELNRPDRILANANGNLFIADDDNQRVRWVNSAGSMTTIAGNGTAGLSGDGGPATSAEFYYIGGITQDASGDFLIADYSNLRIREVSVFSALNTSAGSLDFGLVTLGATATPQTLTLSALGPITFSNISVTGPFTEYDDCGAGLANGKTCVMYVYFKPTAAGTRTGAITIEANGFFSDTTTISLEGTGSAISVAGGPLLFGNQGVKTTSAPKTVSVTNKGTASVTMGAITLNDTTDFATSAKTCPASGSALAAGASCSINVVFKPKTTGAKKAALIINDSDPSSPQIVGLTGTGTSMVILTPSSVSFAAQAVGTTSPLTKITLTNNTGASLTLGSPALSTAAPFNIGTGPTGCTNNLVVAAGQSCFIYVAFTPISVGFPTGTLSVTDSDSTSPQTAALSGTGTGVEFTPSTVTLSNTVGHQASTSVTLTNVGSSTLTFTTAATTGPNAADFSTNNGDPPCRGSLAPGAVCSFTVYFTPSIVGSESATYLVYDNSTGSPQALPLSGTGQ